MLTILVKTNTETQDHNPDFHAQTSLCQPHTLHDLVPNTHPHSLTPRFPSVCLQCIAWRYQRAVIPSNSVQTYLSMYLCLSSDFCRCIAPWRARLMA